MPTAACVRRRFKRDDRDRGVRVLLPARGAVPLHTNVRQTRSDERRDEKKKEKKNRSNKKTRNGLPSYVGKEKKAITITIKPPDELSAVPLSALVRTRTHALSLRRDAPSAQTRPVQEPRASARWRHGTSKRSERDEFFRRTNKKKNQHPSAETRSFRERRPRVFFFFETRKNVKSS